jgi:predicted patatin/cPLA2 family phospholipase
MRRAEFSDARRFLRGGHWFDIDYLWDAFDREDPLDVTRAAAHPTPLVVAATSVDTGAAVYFQPGAGELSDVLRASSAVPVLFRRFVEVGGRRYTDGGMSAPIPVEEAYRRGARRILVIRSRPAGFPGPSRLECLLAALVLRAHPALADAFRRYRAVYTRSVAFLRRPPPGCRVVHVAPPPEFRTRRDTRDEQVLLADYARGRAAGERAIATWESRA